jgi:hypothetical protein
VRQGRGREHVYIHTHTYTHRTVGGDTYTHVCVIRGWRGEHKQKRERGGGGVELLSEYIIHTDDMI